MTTRNPMPPHPHRCGGIAVIGQPGGPATPIIDIMLRTADNPADPPAADVLLRMVTVAQRVQWAVKASGGVHTLVLLTGLLGLVPFSFVLFALAGLGVCGAALWQARTVTRFVLRLYGRAMATEAAAAVYATGGCPAPPAAPSTSAASSR